MLLIYVSVSFPIYNADNAGSRLTCSIIHIPGQCLGVEFTLLPCLWNAQRKVEQLKGNVLKVDVSQVAQCCVVGAEFSVSRFGLFQLYGLSQMWSPQTVFFLLVDLSVQIFFCCKLFIVISGVVNIPS